jgi:predicted DNA-binding transcriptional regulator AlpA
MKANTPAASRDRIVKKAEAAAQFGISYSTLYRLIATNRFPQPVKIGPNRMGFSQIELDNHMAKLKAERVAITALHEAAHAATAAVILNSTISTKSRLKRASTRQRLTMPLKTRASERDMEIV